MADKRKSFRFRLPWRNRGSQVEPEPPPAAKTQNPTQTTTTIPIDRPPFRPAGKAPVKSSPSQAQTPANSEPPPPSPSHAATNETEIQLESFPSSPSLVASHSHQPQGASQVSPQPQSQPTAAQESSRTPSSSAEPRSPASQPEPKKEMSQSPVREPQPNANIMMSETIPNAQSNTPRETAVQTDPVQVLSKEEKTTNSSYKEELHETATKRHAAVTSSGNHAKDLLGVAPKAERRHKKDRKEALASTSSSGKANKTPKDRSSSRMSIQKMVSSTAEQARPHAEIREHVLKLDKLAAENHMLEKPVHVITLTGENIGASMHLSSEAAKQELSVPIHRNYQSNPDDSPEDTTDGEMSNDGKNFTDQMSREDQQMRAYINSNVQSINNAIVFNSSVTEGKPGVHMVFNQNPAESSKSNGKLEPIGTHKAQFTKTPSEKLTHESTVRRRCLRGLFMDSSDSEPDNPEKPRRHGCRYSCGMKRTDTETGTF